MIVGITGANGFIGKNLCEFFDKNTIKYNKINCNVENYNEINDYLSNNPQITHIVHLARKNRDEGSKLLRTNILGTTNIALVCSEKKKRSVCINSDYDKEDVYAVGNKIGTYAVDQINRNIGHYNNTLFLPKVYGPHCKPYYNSFISTILYCISKKLEYESIIYNPDELFKIVYVKHVCKDIYHILKTKSYTSHYYSMFVEMNYTIRKIIELSQDKTTNFGKTVEWYSKNM